MRASFSVTVLVAAAVLAGCGGSSGGGSSTAPLAPLAPLAPPAPPLPPPVSRAEAFKFLNQTTFGATESEAENVRRIGFEAWIDQQIAEPISLQLPYLRSLPQPDRAPRLQPDRVDIWFRNALGGQDQLRQRVAFALSQILVVSEVGALRQAPYGLADYYDVLARNAFGNFRDLMEEATLHPAMGVYLSMLGNQKPDPERSISPDENYAREFMQLFTIGLVELYPDGTTRLDSEGQPIPTYDQDIVEGFAHVFTGWTYANGANFLRARRTDDNQTLPMQLYPNYHATGAKQLLNGVRLPAGQSGDQDLEDALDNLFAHPNVGPFIAIRLIQRLVTSNPSSAYVSRVAATFNNNGSGERGDLEAVVKAILFDEEARSTSQSPSNGKLKEPLLRLTQLWRAYDARSADGSYVFRPQTIYVFAQGPLQSPSVFNFFSPFYAPPGKISEAGMTAPELQVATEYQNALVTNYFYQQAFRRNSNRAGLHSDEVFIDIHEELALAADADALINRVAEKLLTGEISDTLRAGIRGMVVGRDTDDAVGRVAETIYFIVSSPEFARQH